MLAARAAAPTLVLLLTAPALVLGQSTIRWSDFKFCERCTLTSARVLALGERDGPGSVQSDAVKLVAMGGHGYLLQAVGAQSFALFDEEGRFVRAMGRRGQGPGEFTAILGLSFAAGERVVALDHSGKWSTFTGTGQLLAEARLIGVLPGDFRLERGDSTAVVARMDRRREAVGFPLHRVDLVTGKVIGRLGATDPLTWSVGEPWGTEVLIGKGEHLDSTVWWGKVGRPHIEEWSTGGSRRRTITGDLAWFVPVTRTGPPGGAPWSLVTDFAVDGRDQLWLVTLVADPRWQAVRRGAEGSIPSAQASMYFDARVDVFDLPSRRHLGFHTWDSHEVRVLQRSGEVMVYVVEASTPTWPRVVLYRIDVPQLQPRR